MHYYKLNTDLFEPGDEILKQDIIYYIEGKSKGLIKVDLSNFNLTLPPEGAFIGIEWLGMTDNGKFVDTLDDWNDTSIQYNYKISRPLTFLRTRFSNYGWDNTQQLKNDLHIKSANYPNASFGIEVFD